MKIKLTPQQVVFINTILSAIDADNKIAANFLYSMRSGKTVALKILESKIRKLDFDKVKIDDEFII